jgi:hypothetical protein
VIRDMTATTDAGPATSLNCSSLLLLHTSKRCMAIKTPSKPRTLLFASQQFHHVVLGGCGHDVRHDSSNPYHARRYVRQRQRHRRLCDCQFI